jgi:energy-coupling factor transporter ATP-binding protein EcfA2
MTIWDTYPQTYRNNEVKAVASAVQAGECCAVAGLSGSGKSNLLGFMAKRLGRNEVVFGVPNPHPAFFLVDCNRLGRAQTEGLFDLISASLGWTATSPDSYANAGHAVQAALGNNPGICLLFDRFDALDAADSASFAGRLRALRDMFKYELTYVTATRRPPERHSELAELFYAHTLWLGCLSQEDARWSVEKFAQRKGLHWAAETTQAVIDLSLGYPSILRAVCEAHDSGCDLELSELLEHPIVSQRLDEFWGDKPGEAELEACGLANHPFLAQRPVTHSEEKERLAAQLTAKEHLLWQYFHAHPEIVCEKDELIRAVWPEDQIFERGVRDDSLAQLIRRLREKVEMSPSDPAHIQTIPGRGYRFIP